MSASVPGHGPCATATECAALSVVKAQTTYGVTQNGGVKRKDLTIPPPGSILRAESDRNSLHAVGETDLSHQALA